MKYLGLWYTFLCILLGAVYFNYEEGFYHYLWDADISKFSFIIMGYFAYAYGKLGLLLHQKFLFMRDITTHDLDPGYETCNISFGLGILGTVIGLIVGLAPAYGMSLDDPTQVKQLISILVGGISTALLTTAAGLSSSLILRKCYFLTERYLTENKDETITARL